MNHPIHEKNWTLHIPITSGDGLKMLARIYLNFPKIQSSFASLGPFSLGSASLTKRRHKDVVTTKAQTASTQTALNLELVESAKGAEDPRHGRYNLGDWQC